VLDDREDKTSVKKRKRRLVLKMLEQQKDDKSKAKQAAAVDSTTPPSPSAIIRGESWGEGNTRKHIILGTSNNLTHDILQ
jgi:hypothetical protein